MPVANSMDPNEPGENFTVINGSQPRGTASHVTIPVAIAMETSGDPSMRPVHAVPMMVGPGALGGGTAIVVRGGMDVNAALGQSMTATEHEVIRGQKTVSCLALIDCVVAFFNIVSYSTFGLYLLLLILGPISGHYGGKHRCTQYTRRHSNFDNQCTSLPGSKTPQKGARHGLLGFLRCSRLS